jgi:hypothetical protein
MFNKNQKIMIVPTVKIIDNIILFLKVCCGAANELNKTNKKQDTIKPKYFKDIAKKQIDVIIIPITLISLYDIFLIIGG